MSIGIVKLGRGTSLEKQCEVIIVVGRWSQIERDCISSVFRYTDQDKYPVTIYDNSKTDWNLGALWNRLIHKSKCPYVCLLNSDTIVEKGWLTKLVQTAEHNQAAAVGPVTNKCGIKFQVAKKLTDPGVDPEVRVPTLSGFCLVLNKAVVDSIGGFREDFTFYGQETNLLERMVLRKFFMRKDVYIQHVGSATIRGLPHRDFAEEKALSLDIHKRNKTFNWRHRLLVLGSGQGNPFPLWRGIDQGCREFAKQGMVCRHIRFDDPEMSIELIEEFNPSVIIVASSRLMRVQKRLGNVLSHFNIPKGLWINDLRDADDIRADLIADLFSSIFLCWKGDYTFSGKDCSIAKWHVRTNTKCLYMPQGSVIHPRLRTLKEERELVFIGGCESSIHEHREKILEGLCESHNMEVMNCRSRPGRIQIEMESPKIYRESKFVLAQSPLAPGYNSLRLYNILAYGGLALVHRFPGIEDLLTDGKHYLGYSTLSESRKIVNDSSLELEVIRKAGWRLQQAKHTAGFRLMNMIANITTTDSSFWGYL